MPGYRNCRTARHICYVNWTAFECVWSSNRKRFCKIRFSSWTWTLHILSTPFRCSALSDRLIRVLMRGELTLFVSCVEICGFVCSVIRKMCDLRLIPAWWAVLSLSFEENSKIRLQLISRNCQTRVGLGERSSIDFMSRNTMWECPKTLANITWELPLCMAKVVVLRNEAISDKFYPGNNVPMYPFHWWFLEHLLRPYSVERGRMLTLIDVVNSAVLRISMYTLWKHQINYIEEDELCVCTSRRKQDIASERF